MPPLYYPAVGPFCSPPPHSGHSCLPANHMCVCVCVSKCLGRSSVRVRTAYILCSDPAFHLFLTFATAKLFSFRFPFSVVTVAERHADGPKREEKKVECDGGRSGREKQHKPVCDRTENCVTVCGCPHFAPHFFIFSFFFFSFFYSLSENKIKNNKK